MKPIKITVKKKPTNRSEALRVFDKDNEQENIEKMTREIAEALVKSGEDDGRST